MFCIYEIDLVLDFTLIKSMRLVENHCSFLLISLLIKEQKIELISLSTSCTAIRPDGSSERRGVKCELMSLVREQMRTTEQQKNGGLTCFLLD